MERITAEINQKLKLLSHEQKKQVLALIDKLLEDNPQHKSSLRQHRHNIR